MFKLSDDQYKTLSTAGKKYVEASMATGARKAAVIRAEKSYRYPQNAEEWWDVVNTYWDDLILVVQKYVRLEEMCDLSGNINTQTLLIEAIQAKIDKNIDLANLFSRAWVQAPDNGNIHGDMAWGILCDLCSESYVLYPDGPE